MPDQDTSRLLREWTELAPAWIREVRTGRNPARRGLLDPVMMAACGDVRGLNVLDSGCGEGRFSRMLVEKCAEFVLGLDLCQPMIESARELQTGRDSYQVADVQELSFLGAETFDLAVSYLNQCDLPDFRANTREIFRVLKPGGRFVIVNLHPMRSAVGGWQTTNDGTKLHVILDSYFAEGERHWTMLGLELTNFHRTLETYIRAYRESGFAIENLIEPTVDPEVLKRYPELDDERRVPNFVVFVLRKPAREGEPDHLRKTSGSAGPQPSRSEPRESWRR